MLDYLASRFEFSDQINAVNIELLKQRNPAFYALVRNSLSDNFVPPAADSLLQEHQWIFTHAVDYGVDPEDVYLHFWTDTEVLLEGQVVWVPGWQPGSPKSGASAASRVDARVPVYYKDLTRRATNFATPQIRAVHRAYNVASVSQPVAGNHYWEGFFFDNAGNYGLQLGIVTTGQYPSGGQVAEHPTHAVVNTAEFQSWYWYQGMGLFMNELRQWAARSPPELAGRPLRIMPNVYNLPYLDSPDWQKAYLDLHPGDTLFQEYEMNPVRDSSRTYPSTIFQQNSRARAAGIDLFQPGLSVTAQAPYAGSYTLAEALMNTLSLHWVTRTPNVVVLGHQANTVTGTDWQQNQSAIFDIDLGAALGDPYVLATGTDAHSPGYGYTVYAREFACGLSIVRQRGASDQDMDASTSVTVTLPRPYIPVDADGNRYPETQQWTLRNGQGQMFVSATVATPPSINYEGLWWNSPAGSESGWGINLAHQGDVIFASWFTYDATGKAWWLIMSAPNKGGDRFSGTLYQMTGPAFDEQVFDPAQVSASAVGSGLLGFVDANNAIFTYTVDGITQVKNITREIFGPLPTCSSIGAGNSFATNYQDLWWRSPAGSESGWGINLTHQGDRIFATWFTYDHDRTPMWLSVTADRTAPASYSGTLYRTSGPPFNTVPFDSSKIVSNQVGTAAFRFGDGNDALFESMLYGVHRSIPITRQVFQAPGTVCAN